MISSKGRLVILWLLLVIGMILHFNYHVGEIFYGIDVVRANATGEVPIGTVIIRTIFYHLPMIWILVIIYTDKKIVRMVLLIISAVYLLAHGAHLAEELFAVEKDISQTSLLAVVLLVSGMTSVEHYKYWKEIPR
ncbi:MAG: hypothetical protein AAF519_20370 [Bacteroidota bacterium]